MLKYKKINWHKTYKLLCNSRIFLNERDMLDPVDIELNVTVAAEINLKLTGDFPGLPPEAIKQFQEICKKKGLELSDAKATEEALNLINLVRIVSGQTPIVALTTKEK